jgi:tight adherence protein B
VSASGAIGVPALLAVVSAGVAAALLWPGPGLLSLGPARVGFSGREQGGGRGVTTPLAVVTCGVLAAAVLPIQHVVLALIAGGAGWGGALLVRRRRAARAAEQTSVRLLEACEQLTGELVAGRPPSAALEHCAAEWDAIGPVAEAFRVGADVPDAWRQVAERPGAADLRVVAAAWQVSHRTGAGLASALEHVTVDLRAQRATRRVVAGELASARATARLIALLPVLALTFGAGTGGDPWGFLLSHPVGLGCLALGLAFALAGLAWIEALAREVDRR